MDLDFSNFSQEEIEGFYKQVSANIRRIRESKGLKQLDVALEIDIKSVAFYAFNIYVAVFRGVFRPVLPVYIFFIYSLNTVADNIYECSFYFVLITQYVMIAFTVTKLNAYSSVIIH